MDPFKVEKFRAMKSYEKKNHFVYNLFLHFLAALICSLLWSSPYWFPSLCSSMKHFCLISLPCIWSSFFNPKCIFVVVNIIVIFLVGESKLVSTSSSPSDDIYNEYVERSRSLRGNVSTSHEKSMTINDEKVEEEKEVELIIKEVSRVENKQQEEEEKENYGKVETMETVEEDDEEKEEEGEEEAAGLPLTLMMEGEDKERGDKDEEEGLPVEELNKKVEEFIARVNKQRWLEVNSFLSIEA